MVERKKKEGRGRPKLPEDEKRSVQLVVLLTKVENKQLRQADTTVADFVRGKLFGMRKRRREIQGDKLTQEPTSQSDCSDSNSTTEHGTNTTRKEQRRLFE